MAWKDLVELFVTLRELGRNIINAAPMQFCIANAVKRVIHIVREVAKANGIALPKEDEYKLSIGEEGLSIDSLYDIIQTPPGKVLSKEDCSKKLEELKVKLESDKNNHQQEILGQIKEVLVEMENMRLNIYEQAKEYILPNDVILTYDLSITVLEFFKVPHTHTVGGGKRPQVRSPRSRNRSFLQVLPTHI
eukprot:TRINITY_DN1735_c0_g1_i2.p2 TRINITY_DN1735_c0_g1~~TRINITY_DN1735_c0_g1_i2.p2  ORF type:complete len:191 (+),score=52.52 TRINITY_DN1735_c0_g1_i2:831-1403(+)